MNWYRVTHVSFHNGRWLLYTDDAIDVPDGEVIGIEPPVAPRGIIQYPPQFAIWRGMTWRPINVSSNHNWSEPSERRIVILPEFPYDTDVVGLAALREYKKKLLDDVSPPPY
jgi:hypothetical protein